MELRLRESDCKTLEYLADYRILTMSQLAAVCQKGKPAVRKRIRDLKKEGLVKVACNELAQNLGRPESLLALTEQGGEILKEKNLIAKEVSYEHVGPASPRLIDHKLLLNWFRLHLGQIERILPQLSVRFLAYNSPFVPQGNGKVKPCWKSQILHRYRPKSMPTKGSPRCCFLKAIHHVKPPMPTAGGNISIRET